MNLEDLLIKTVEEEASDLHITVGTAPRIRKSGTLLELGNEKLSADKVKELIESKMTNIQIDNFNSGNEIDYSIGIPGISRFRVNVYSQRGNICAAYRRLPLEPPAIDTLGLPDTIVDLLEQKKGH